MSNVRVPPSGAAPAVVSESLGARLRRLFHGEVKPQRARTAADDAHAAAVRKRIILLAVFLGIGLAYLGVRAAQLQIEWAPTLQEMADEQHWREFQPPVWRGPIVDRNGAALALTVDVDSVFANPKDLEDPDVAAQELARALGMDVRTLALRLHSGSRFVWLKRLVTPAEAEAVRKLALPGVQLTREPKRFYPGRNIAAHLVGFVGYDSRGLDGLEHEYDAALRSEPRVWRGVRDARGRMVFADGLGRVEVPQEQRVELAIDRTIQFIAEQELAAALAAFEGKAGSVVVMDPRTGEVLALANGPTYDPNRYAEFDADERRNRALTDRFEPGSTLKIFTMAALLDAGLVPLEEQIYCEDGVYSIGDYKIHDAHRNEWLTLTQCLQRSSNVCLAKLAGVLGKSRLYDALRRFGFGERTGVPVPGETSGLLRHYSKWYEVDLAAISFGQGISVSNLQLATAVSVVANGGVLMRPILVRRVLGADGRLVADYPPTARRRVIDERTARLVASMLISVTEEGGTGTEARIAGFDVAGKTGTAQKANPDAPGYSKDKWTASFVGFVPAEDPRLVISVSIDEPVINHYGGIVAAPVFRRIAERALRYLGVAPQRADEPAPAPADEADAVEGGALGVTGVPLALPAAGMIEVPDFTGETIRAALGIARDFGLELLIRGAGLGASQDPRPGTGVPPGATVTVEFELPGEEPR
ncbi:MAG: transpeptidase family protein [Deltaproteobacteria bacterium]|nr:transpeptidase family protein [Deltaproteobacteria bacterium]